MSPPRGQAKWIWLPGFKDSDDVVPGKVVLFRKTFELLEIPTRACRICVSADTRYKLYINGTYVVQGPCKSYPTRWYYETIDIAPFLHAGTNIIAAKVLRFFPSQIGSSSLMRAPVPGFILWGHLGQLSLATDETWLCCEDESIQLKPRSEWNYILGPPFLSLDERVEFSRAYSDYQDETVDPSQWSMAVPAVQSIKMMPALEPWKLFERPIPLLPEAPKSFHNALKCTGPVDLQQWNNLLCSNRPLIIAANQTVSVDFEVAVLTTGFVEFDFVGGDGAEAFILYAESYEQDLGIATSPFPLPRSKADRRDWKNGQLYGNEDQVILAGGKTLYEPFWFRTFRFIRLTVHTKQTPATIQRVGFRETYYPLDITTKVNLSSNLKPIWDICLNTLRNCMHETYEDCPFYEQNQFAMDGRLQLLFTYQLSRDDRLARKTIHEFHASRREDGLLETNFPVSFRAISIPQFSLFWILMLHDHMMYFGDAGLVRRYISTADGILDFFDSLINEDGLVGAFDPECWAFVDWVKEWHGTNGIRDMAVPPIYKKTGVVAYNSLLYTWVLQRAAELCEFIHRQDIAAEYRRKAESLNQAVRTGCFTGEFFIDGPGAGEICEHTQVFAVLSGAVSGEEATQLMRRTMEHSTMPRCSYAMKHYVFRALEKAGLYTHYFAEMMRPWEKMVENNLTTCAEDDVSFRSDCHGWSASPIYEIVACVHGIRPGAPGFKSVQLEPNRELMKTAEARYKLPTGYLSDQWSEDGIVEIDSTVEVDVKSSIPNTSQEKRPCCPRRDQEAGRDGGEVEASRC
jgi:alpha-L-rhamnosidase